eukprot:CAMPEP_0118721296 /NCGR_PEP_ID=MMETSP0800-20121206/30636_1 /TAXON_ID=210618 ORGANISM="Striatella unipunctata, Strain CCMP2910" /NCGR_SAMPLE_ID=MMETSP0800 /ASSEMBLY_ACC=CAM_ASM_000638 /LENGTH=425 /DNA_ID=CAMNT_0006629129 /DNA_START=1 /DNA_END=1278 /DNA_ORIENTATION=+
MLSNFVAVLGTPFISDYYQGLYLNAAIKYELGTCSTSSPSISPAPVSTPTARPTMAPTATVDLCEEQRLITRMNGNVFTKGSMFDVTPVLQNRDIFITEITLRIDTNETDIPVRMWIKNGTVLGSERNATAWTSLDRGIIRRGRGPEKRSVIQLARYLFVPASGTSTGIFMRVPDEYNIVFTLDDPSKEFSDKFIKLSNFVSKSGLPFSNQQNNGQYPNAAIKYELASCSTLSPTTQSKPTLPPTRMIIPVTPSPTFETPCTEQTLTTRMNGDVLNKGTMFDVTPVRNKDVLVTGVSLQIDSNETDIPVRIWIKNGTVVGGPEQDPTAWTPLERGSIRRGRGLGKKSVVRLPKFIPAPALQTTGVFFLLPEHVNIVFTYQESKEFEDDFINLSNFVGKAGVAFSTDATLGLYPNAAIKYELELCQ